MGDRRGGGLQIDDFGGSERMVAEPAVVAKATDIGAAFGAVVFGKGGFVSHRINAR